jgi:hypothetical protein
MERPCQPSVPRRESAVVEGPPSGQLQMRYAQAELALDRAFRLDGPLHSGAELGAISHHTAIRTAFSIRACFFWAGAVGGTDY